MIIEIPLFSSKLYKMIIEYLFKVPKVILMSKWF